jgi:hypothetical protein
MKMSRWSQETGLAGGAARNGGMGSRYRRLVKCVDPAVLEYAFVMNEPSLEAAIDRILIAVAEASSRTSAGVSWFEPDLVLVRRGDVDAGSQVAEMSDLESAWLAIDNRVPQDELLYMNGQDAGRCTFTVLVCAYDLPPRTRIYTIGSSRHCPGDDEEDDEEETRLIASTTTPSEDTDERFVDWALSPTGGALAHSLGVDDLDLVTSLRPASLRRMVAQAIEEGILDEFVRLIAENAPADLEPSSTAWTLWVADRFIEVVTPRPDEPYPYDVKKLQDGADDADVSVNRYSSIFLVNPNNARASEWLREHAEGNWMGGAVMVAYDDIAELIKALQGAGFAVWSGAW